MRADQVNLVEIGGEDEGQRVDNYLLRVCKGVPKSHVYRVIRDGEVRVNKRRVSVDYRLAAGDLLRVPPIRLAVRAPQVVPGAEFPVLHEDAELLIVNKPAGVAVHGGSGVSFGVIEQLRAARPQARYLELVHRLDRETSGILMLAKKRSALVNLHEQFKAGTTDKRYLALAGGKVLNERQHLRMPLFKFTDANGERQVRVTDAADPNAMTAHTIASVIERFAALPVDPATATLVECQLKTGRTHQIRVHLASSGHPILGDPKYGDFALNKLLSRHGLKRMFLHAVRLSIDHPATGERLAIEAPLPADCLKYLEKLRHA
nr:RluA family pseudouridine synthase [Derxia lacustris]